MFKTLYTRKILNRMVGIVVWRKKILCGVSVNGFEKNLEMVVLNSRQPNLEKNCLCGVVWVGVEKSCLSAIGFVGKTRFRFVSWAIKLVAL